MQFTNKSKTLLDDNISVALVIIKQVGTVFAKSGLTTMPRPLREDRNEIGLNEYLLPQLRIQALASAYVSAHQVPLLRERLCCEKDRTAAVVK